MKLPFLALNCRTPQGLIPAEHSGARGYAVVFTDRVHADDYLQQNPCPDLELSLVGRHCVKDLLDRLESARLVGIAFDPKPDSVNLVTLAELRSLCF